MSLHCSPILRSNQQGKLILTEQLLTHPAIEKGLPDYEIFSRYGSAALPMHLPSADKIWLSRP